MLSARVQRLQSAFTADYINEATTVLHNYVENLGEAESLTLAEKKKKFAAKQLASVFETAKSKGLYSTSKRLAENRDSYETKMFVGLANILYGKDIKMLQMKVPYFNKGGEKTNFAGMLGPGILMFRAIGNACLASFLWQFVRSDQFKKGLKENYEVLSVLDESDDLSCTDCSVSMTGKACDLMEEHLSTATMNLQEGFFDSLKLVGAACAAVNHFSSTTTGYDVETIRIFHEDLKTNPAWGKVCMLFIGIVFCIAAIAASLLGASAVCGFFTGGACGAFGIWVTGVVLSIVGTQGWKYGSIALKTAVCHPNCKPEDLKPLPALNLTPPNQVNTKAAEME